MAIRFVLLVNKQGQTRLAQYYEYLTLDERRALEGEIVRRCLSRSDSQVSLLLPSHFFICHDCNFLFTVSYDRQQLIVFIKYAYIIYREILIA
jgi:AP-4 complex subunit sigma-1